MTAGKDVKESPCDKNKQNRTDSQRDMSHYPCIVTSSIRNTHLNDKRKSPRVLGTRATRAHAWSATDPSQDLLPLAANVGAGLYNCKSTCSVVIYNIRGQRNTFLPSLTFYHIPTNYVQIHVGCHHMNTIQYC